MAFTFDTFGSYFPKYRVKVLLNHYQFVPNTIPFRTNSILFRTNSQIPKRTKTKYHFLIILNRTLPFYSYHFDLNQIHIQLCTNLSYFFEHKYILSPSHLFYFFVYDRELNDSGSTTKPRSYHARYICTTSSIDDDTTWLSLYLTTSMEDVLSLLFIVDALDADTSMPRELHRASLSSRALTCWQADPSSFPAPRAPSSSNPAYSSSIQLA